MRSVSFRNPNQERCGGATYSVQQNEERDLESDRQQGEGETGKVNTLN